MQFRPHRITITQAGAISLAVVAGTLIAAGCGASSPPTRSGTQAAHPTGAPSSPEVGQASVQVGVGSSAATKSSPVGHPSQGLKLQQARSQLDGTRANGSGTEPKSPNPCALVSIAQAQTITGGAVVGRLEAPLGPTCIYQLGAGNVTLAVESMSFPQVAHQMRGRSPVSIGGRHGYCGRLGTQMLFLPLSGGRVLNVTAPCAQAQRFAAAALSHLAA